MQGNDGVSWGEAESADWELNQQPFGSQAGVQSTEPYQPGLNRFFKYKYVNTRKKGKNTLKIPL